MSNLTWFRTHRKVVWRLFNGLRSRDIWCVHLFSLLLTLIIILSLRLICIILFLSCFWFDFRFHNGPQNSSRNVSGNLYPGKRRRRLKWPRRYRVSSKLQGYENVGGSGAKERRIRERDLGFLRRWSNLIALSLADHSDDRPDMQMHSTSKCGKGNVVVLVTGTGASDFGCRSFLI